MTLKRSMEAGDPVTVRLKPVLAFNQENSPVKIELEQRRIQLKNRIVNALAGEPVEVFLNQKYFQLQDLLTNEIDKTLTHGYRIQAVYFESIYIE